MVQTLSNKFNPFILLLVRSCTLIIELITWIHVPEIKQTLHHKKLPTLFYIILPILMGIL